MTETDRNDLEKKKLIIVAGPTAVGKSAAAVQLAKKMRGQVVSADSMQVYRHMDIGSAKIRPEETEGVPHHLIDCLDPTEEFNVTLFQDMAYKAMDEIYEAGDIPVIAGGTGFYIQSILYNIDFKTTEVDTAYRAELEKEGELRGKEFLHAKLREVDPASADAIPAGNMKRVIRALEYYHSTGKQISVHNEEERRKEPAYNAAFFVLTMPRDILYKRIDLRVDQMMEEGLVDEVRRLMDMGVTENMTSMQGLGYRQIVHYLQGKTSLDAAVDLIKKETRHFAKRQLTWFRREKNVIWVDRQQFTDNNALCAYLQETAEAVLSGQKIDNILPEGRNY